MARLRDALPAIRAVGPFKFLKAVYREINDDNLFTWASALAYSWLFAIFPFFLFLLTLLPLLRDDWKAEAVQRIDQAVSTLPVEAREDVRTFLAPKLDQLLYGQTPGIGIVGLIITVWAASGGMAMTMTALDKCFDVEETRPIWIHRPIAIGLTLVVASLILVVIILLPVGTLVTNQLTASTERLLHLTPATQPAQPHHSPADVSATAPAATQAAATQAIVPIDPVTKPVEFGLFLTLWQIGRYAIALLLLFLCVGLVYHFGPNVRRRFRLLTPGAVFTVTVWIGLGLAFRIYVDRFGKYAETYGAVGGAIILLFFFYLDGLVLLVGAEIDAEVEASIKALTGQKEPPVEKLLKATIATPPGTVEPVKKGPEGLEKDDEETLF